MEVEFYLQGERRLGRLIKINYHTAWVRPLSKHPSCVHLNSLHTKVIKRHLTKHKVTANLAWTKYIMDAKHIARDRKYLVWNAIWQKGDYSAGS